MAIAHRRRRTLGAGIVAAALVFAAPPVGTGVGATDGVDVDIVVTGSVDPDALVSKAPSSATFRKTLDAVVSGEVVAAYELARSLPNEIERRTIQWAAIYHGGGKVDYASVLKFSQDAPAFVDISVFKTRLEQALTRADADGAEIIRLLGGAMPNTIDAQIALALAYVEDGQRERGARIARTIWTENFLDRQTENTVHKKLGALLDRDAHWDRAVRLMMHDRASGVERLLPYMSAAQKSLAVARNAVSRNAKDAKKLLDNVDPAYRSHPVFLFSRAQRARQFELWDDAVAWLNKSKGEVPEAAEWWYERRTLTRRLLALGKNKLAYKAAAGYREGPEGRLVEAHFHAGWIALAFLDDAGTAAGHFDTMRGFSTLPDSVAQAHYWLGRAKLALGDKLGSNEAYATAARHGTVYYGLLARAELGMKGVHLRSMPAWQQSEAVFESREIVRAVRLLADNGQWAMAVPLLRSFAEGLQDGGELLLAARLAQAIGAHHLAISIADTADRRGFPLDLFSFPKDGLPSGQLASIDKAAVYAIAKQESYFQADAVSSSGARGLMQLMPATAKETAAKVGVAYSKSRLTSDPTYNALLGSTYLAAQLQRFEGSLVLAAAAYNAGGGNANKWITAFGDPRSDEVDPVIWVELIPFQETRKYVQRVLGNYLVYRTRLGQDDMSLRQALRRIPG
jgi:soluble lytic murein transglycosylase